MSVFSDMMERLRSLIFRSRDERELDEELRTHMEMEAEYRRRSGDSENDARRRSTIALGGLERVKDDVRDARGTRLLDDTMSDVRFALRTLANNPAFTVVAVLTLAVGIGGTTAVFSAVDAVLLQPLPYQQPGQLVRLFQGDTRRRESRGFVTPVHFLEFRRNMRSFEAIAAISTYSESGADIGSGDGVRRIRTLPTSADYFRVVRVQPELGRGFTTRDEDGSAVVILSHRLWKEQLRGDPNAVGQMLTMDGRPHVIAGVMPDGFVDPLAGAVDAWVPTDVRPGNDPSNADNHYYTLVARLRSGVSIGQAQAELDALGRELANRYANARNATAQLYALKEDIVGPSSRALQLMLAAVGVVLVLVCVNIANLLLVRGSERAQEFALRSALGAERARLARQMLIESLTLAVGGAIAGLVVARLSMSAIVALGHGTIPRLSTLTLDPQLLAFSLVIASLSAILFGLAPALRVSRTQPGDVLRDQSRSSTGGSRQIRLREWLVVSQVAMALVLVVGAGLLLSSFHRIQQVPLGVSPDNVLTFQLHLPDQRYDSLARGRFYDEFAQRVAALPGVRAAGGTSRLPSIGHFNSWGVEALTGPLVGTREGRGGAENRVVSGEYFQAVGIPVLKGRAFDATDDLSAPAHMIVSKSLAARLWPKTDPIGQRLETGGRTGTVVGVVGDVSVNNEGEPASYVYHPHRQFAGDRNWSLDQVVALKDAKSDVQQSIRRLLATIDPQLVLYDPIMLDDAIGVGAGQRIFTLRILLAFAGVAIVLAALGLYGVLSYGVRLRGREFSIRMALGAERAAIRGMVLRRGLIVAAVGIAIGLVGAMSLSRLMASMLFHVSPLDPVVLAAGTVFMMIVAAAAAYLPAHRATTMDPRSALQ